MDTSGMSSVPKTAQAGTVESMDCLVTITDCGRGRGERSIEIAGSGAGRFKSAMLKKINAVLDELESRVADAPGILVSVQDNGALDVVLGARVEAAYLRLIGGGAR